jgi:hypothetical protein
MFSYPIKLRIYGHKRISVGMNIDNETIMFDIVEAILLKCLMTAALLSSPCFYFIFVYSALFMYLLLQA